MIKSEKKHRELVLIKKDALGKNKPSSDVKVTKNHMILVKEGALPVSKLLNSSIEIVNNNSEVYNIILLNNNYIKVSNIFLNVFKDDNYMKKMKKKKRMD